MGGKQITEVLTLMQGLSAAIPPVRSMLTILVSMIYLFGIKNCLFHGDGRQGRRLDCTMKLETLEGSFSAVSKPIFAGKS